MKSFIVKQLDKVFNPDDYKPANGRDKKKADFNRDNFNKKEWQELWKRINVRTYYNVNFDTSKLIENAVDELDKHLNVTEIRIVVESGAMEGIRDREELEAGTAMSTGKVRTIHVKETVGNNVKIYFYHQNQYFAEFSPEHEKLILELLKLVRCHIKKQN